jgi:hypothetical protein
MDKDQPLALSAGNRSPRPFAFRSSQEDQKEYSYSAGRPDSPYSFVGYGFRSRDAKDVPGVRSPTRRGRQTGDPDESVVRGYRVSHFPRSDYEGVLIGSKGIQRTFQLAIDFPQFFHIPGQSIAFGLESVHGQHSALAPKYGGGAGHDDNEPKDTE